MVRNYRPHRNRNCCKGTKTHLVTTEKTTDFSRMFSNSKLAVLWVLYCGITDKWDGPAKIELKKVSHRCVLCRSKYNILRTCV